MKSADPLAGSDIQPLLELEALGGQRFLASHYDLNQQGRIYGGQLLAQAGVAASRLAANRSLTYLSALFLRGAIAGYPIEYSVETLQQGRRFSSFHVRGIQRERPVIDVNVSFQAHEVGVEHTWLMEEGVPPPEACQSLEGLAYAHASELARHNYQLLSKTTIEARFVEPEDFLFKAAVHPKMAFWIRLRGSRLENALQRSLATIYLSDYFLGYCIIASHRPMVGARNDMYVASLNHAIWLHEQCDPADWLLCVAESPCANSGRGLSLAKLYRRDGALVASVSQEMSVTAKL